MMLTLAMLGAGLRRSKFVPDECVAGHCRPTGGEWLGQNHNSEAGLTSAWSTETQHLLMRVGLCGWSPLSPSYQGRYGL